MAKSPFGSLADLIAQLGVQPEQPKPQEPGVETPKPQDPDKPKPEVPQSDLGKVFDKKATFTLTNKTDKVAAKEGDKQDMVVEGKTSTDWTASTLNKWDAITGGEGKDTLIASLEGRFTGFDKDAGLKGVEHVALQTAGSAEFVAKNVEGVEAYTLKGNVNLSELSALANVNLINRTADAKIGFNNAAEKTLKDGEEDAIVISVDGVGKAPAKAGKNAEYVAVNVSNVEEMTFNAVGKDSFVENGSAIHMAVNGAGNLTLRTGLNHKMESFDASAATGKIVADFSKGTDALESVALGKGDDRLILNLSKIKNLDSVNAGQGRDTLELDGAGSLDLTKTAESIEVIKLGKINGATDISAKELGDLEEIVVSQDVGHNVEFNRMDLSGVNLKLQGKNAAATKAITLDHEGGTSISIEDAEEKATQKKPTENKFGVTLDKSDRVSVEVAEKMNYTGTIIADEAMKADVTINGKMKAATLSLAKVGELDIKAVATDSSFMLNAAELTKLTATTAASLAITGAHGNLSEIKATHEGNFKMGDLAKLTDARFKSEQGKGSVDLGNIGATTLAEEVYIKAENLTDDKDSKKALKLGTINTQAEDVTIEASEIKGAVAIGAIGTDTSNSVGNLKLNVDATGVVSVGNIFANSITSDRFTTTSKGTSAVKAVSLGTLEAKERIDMAIEAAGSVATGATIKAEEEVVLKAISSKESVELGAISKTGAASLASVSITLEADKKATVGTIAADAVTLNLTAKESSQVGNITVKDSLTLVNNKAVLNNGVAVNVEVGGAGFVANLTGGKNNEKFAFTAGSADGDRSFTLKGDLGRGEDTITINTSADDDSKFTIDLSELASSKTGVKITTDEAMADTIKLGAAKETVVLNATTGGATDADKITGFAIGNKGDVLDVKTAVAADVATANFSKTTLAGIVDATKWTKVTVVTDAVDSLDATAIKTAWKAKVTTDAKKFYFVASNDTDAGVYLVTAGGATMEDATIKQVATLVGVNAEALADFVADNFVIA